MFIKVQNECSEMLTKRIAGIHMHLKDDKIVDLGVRWQMNVEYTSMIAHYFYKTWPLYPFLKFGLKIVLEFFEFRLRCLRCRACCVFNASSITKNIINKI